MHIFVVNYEKDNIMQAIDQYRKWTCIRFVPRTDETERYFRFVRNETGCWSYIGYVRSLDPQALSLQPGCVDVSLQPTVMTIKSLCSYYNTIVRVEGK